jgi:hypothetical protein
LNAIDAALTTSPVVGPLTNAADLAAMAAFFIFVLLGIYAPAGQAMPRTHHFGQAPPSRCTSSATLQLGSADAAGRHRPRVRRGPAAPVLRPVRHSHRAGWVRCAGPEGIRLQRAFAGLVSTRRHASAALQPCAVFWQNAGFWGVWYVYFGWAASQFYTGVRWTSWFKGMLATALGHAMIIGILITATLVAA